MHEKFYSHLKCCHGWTSVSITTVRFLSALGALRHSRCQRYFRQRGARIWRIMHRRIHNWLHLRPARMALMPDVYHVYGADRRDRNVDCLDNAGENANSRLAIIGTFSREILGVHASITACVWATTSAARMLSSSVSTCIRVFAWNLTSYVREQHPTAFVANYGNITRRESRLGIKWKPCHYSFYNSAHLPMLTALCSYVLTGWSHVSRAVGKLYKINRCQTSRKTFREDAFRESIHPCRAILINREGRHIVAVLDEQLLRIAITFDDNWSWRRRWSRYLTSNYKIKHID